MSYSGSDKAKEAREKLGEALQALQEDDLPKDVLAVTENIAQSVAALFEAERASTEPDGKSCVKSALGSLSQTLALLQDVQGDHESIRVASEVMAKAMSLLYPLTTLSSVSAGRTSAPPADSIPKSAAVPEEAKSFAEKDAADAGSGDKKTPSSKPPTVSGILEANIGATTESNFYVGFSGEVADGGVFLASYDTLPVGSITEILVTLPGGFEMKVKGEVRFVRDPFDLNSDSEPGMGIQFGDLKGKDRELILRFIRKRPPMFYDD